MPLRITLQYAKHSMFLNEHLCSYVWDNIHKALYTLIQRGEVKKKCVEIVKQFITAQQNMLQFLFRVFFVSL
jgi:hypothetical protein